LFWGFYDSLEMLAEYMPQVELQHAESAWLVLLFVGFASTSAKVKGEAVSVLPSKTFWAAVRCSGVR